MKRKPLLTALAAMSLALLSTNAFAQRAKATKSSQLPQRGYT